MYDLTEYIVGVRNIAEYLGVGRNTALDFCQRKPCGFPVVQIGKRYQADKVLLEEWRLDFYRGKFTEI